MNNDNKRTLQCHLTVPHKCSYLPERMTTNLVLDPGTPLTDELLALLLDNGFRRSGKHIYRPSCDTCSACIPLRIPTHRFQPDRSQRRNWRTNRHLRHAAHPAALNDEHFDLYCRYLATRHQGSEMSDPIPADYIGFLTAPGVTTTFHEFRLEDKLIAVAVTDHVPTGLSAVYTFFDPDYDNRGIGTYAILWQIEHARQLGLPWIYLGYWIKECGKMAYKSRFRPFEAFIDEKWQQID